LLINDENEKIGDNDDGKRIKNGSPPLVKSKINTPVSDPQNE
jgi:hypothetical protein